MQKDGALRTLPAPSRESILLPLYEGMEKFVQLTLLSDIVMGMITTGEKLEILTFREILSQEL